MYPFFSINMTINSKANKLRDILMADRQVNDVEYMRTGCTLLDLLIGGKKDVLGFPYGCILDITGDKSSGKSFLKNEIIATNYWKKKAEKKPFKWFSDDCESGDTFDSEEMYGFDIHPSDRKLGGKSVEDSDTIEEMDAHVALMLDSMADSDVGIYAIDSIDGISDKHREDKATKRMNQAKKSLEVKDDGDFGTGQAKFLSQQFFPTKHKKLKDKKCTLLLINQLRENVAAAGPLAPKWKISGGKALEFYFHTQVFLKTVRKIESNGIIVGAFVKATTTKSKTPRPYRECYYSVYFNYGIDNIGSNIDYLFDLRDEKGMLPTECVIPWNGKAELNMANLKAWIDSNGWLDECRAYAKERNGKALLNLDTMKAWCSENKASEFKDYFGETYTRDELIAMIERDPSMAEELERRVIAKWEAKEDAADVMKGRAKRFGV